MAKVRVDFLGPIGMDSQEFEVKNLEELKEKLHKIDGLEEWLNNSAIALNDEIIERLDCVLCDGDRIALLPPVCGG